MKEEVSYADHASNQYEIFWCKFREGFYNWLQRLQTKEKIGSHSRSPHTWTQVDLIELHRLDTDLTRAIKIWVQATLGGYIIEFIVEGHLSFSKAGAMLIQGYKEGY